MEITKTYTDKGLKAHNFEKTNNFINSLLDARNTVRHTGTSRRRVIPKMLTHPIKEAPHL